MMSNATELLRRALDRIDWVYPSDIALKDEIRAFLAAEPEAEPYTQSLYPELTPRADQNPVAWMYVGKSIDTIVTRFKATDLMSGVLEIPLYPYPAEISDPVAYLWCFDTGLTTHRIEMHRPPTKDEMEDGFVSFPLYTRPEPARTPMTEEEMRKGSGEWAHLHNIFEEGVRFAEKHHEIGGGDD
jgi:hypothetical protein